MMRCNTITFLLLCFSCIVLSQDKYEQEFRIKKSQFPNQAYTLVSEYLLHAKRIRFYQEIDSTKKSFEVKFKKDRIYYSIEFDEQGQLEDVEFRIKEKEIPDATWSKMDQYFKSHFSKLRIRKIQRQYPLHAQDTAKTVRDAFQNLLLPYINYEIVFSAKKDKGFQTYEALFNATGDFISLRQSFSPSYDHVLY